MRLTHSEVKEDCERPPGKGAEALTFINTVNTALLEGS